MLKRDGYLQPAILQGIGIVMLIASFVIWALTGNESPLLVAAALALIGVGSGVGAIVTVRQQISANAYDKEKDEDHEK